MDSWARSNLREIDHKITHPRVDNYLYAMLPARPPVLADIEKQADERDIPIVGPAVGRLLYQYARIIGARQIFEMGFADSIWAKRIRPTLLPARSSRSGPGRCLSCCQRDSACSCGRAELSTRAGAG